MARGGAREGAGRPKGSISETAKERLEAKRILVERVRKNTEKLLNKQLDIAMGETSLFCTVTIGEGSKQRRETHIVTDPDTIKQFLDDELDYDKDKEYYFISTKPGDLRAIENLFDRAYGRPTEKVELGGENEADLSELSQEELDARIDRYLERRRSN